MKIYRDIPENQKHLFSSSAIALQNAFLIIEEDRVYTYEFQLFGFEAEIKSNTMYYLEDVIEEFRFFNAVIHTFHFQGKIIKSYEPKAILRLPISILQPSQFFIDEGKLANIDAYMLEEEIYLPVALIDDEYVLLDGHTRAYSLYSNSQRMVNCYFDTYDESIKEFVYLAKEQNILNVSQMEILTSEEYKIQWHGFCDAFFKVYK